jgi:hypothetical protein
MRLLNINTMKLEEWFGDQIPPYVILSHCWGEEEVTFLDINGLGWNLMKGAKKIMFAARQCRHDNHKYVWIDTCCIDKSSSAELSEAINSMYEWYSLSKHCYAYLEDAYTQGTAVGSILELLMESRWFTRGWTLQELIAPSSVRFYDNCWELIGEKRDLSNILAYITSIPIEVLERPVLGRDCSISRRMTWVAARNTTRVEDMAYCLLGIFDVKMPLLYGEGTKAFVRLQEEIMKETDDHSLFAWGILDDDDDDIYTDALHAENYNLFATSPADFLGSENVIPFPADPDQPAHFMTNKGLRIELPTWVSENNCQIMNGRLNCHFENDFYNCLGIQLRTTEDKSIFLRLRGTTIYEIGEVGPIGRILPAVTESCAVHIAKRSLNPKSIEKDITRRICLLECQSVLENGYTIAKLEPGCQQISTSSGTKRTIEIRPTSYINEESQYPVTCHVGGVEIIFRHQTNATSVLLQAKFKETEERIHGWRSWLMGAKGLRLRRLERNEDALRRIHSMAEIVEYVDNDEKNTLQCERRVGPHRIMATLSEQSMLNQEVYVLKVECQIQPYEPTSSSL